MCRQADSYRTHHWQWSAKPYRTDYNLPALAQQQATDSMPGMRKAGVRSPASGAKRQF
jgi:hypothetical protein